MLKINLAKLVPGIFSQYKDFYDFYNTLISKEIFIPKGFRGAEGVESR